MVFSSRENDDLHDDDHGGLLLFPSSPRAQRLRSIGDAYYCVAYPHSTKLHSVWKLQKSRIQQCERSELQLHFEWTKVHQKWSILASLWKPELWDIFGDFQTLWVSAKSHYSCIQRVPANDVICHEFSPILELNSHYIFKVYRIFSAICQVKIFPKFYSSEEKLCNELLEFPMSSYSQYFFSTKKETSM